MPLILLGIAALVLVLWVSAGVRSAARAANDLASTIERNRGSARASIEIASQRAIAAIGRKRPAIERWAAWWRALGARKL